MSTCCQPIKAAAAAVVMLVAAVPIAAQTITCDSTRVLLSERVIDAQSRMPLHNAAVSVTWRVEGNPASAVARSDSSGLALLCVPPAIELVIRSSYRDVTATPATVVLRRGVPFDHITTIALPADIIPLAPVVVTAQSRRLDGVGFYDRQKRGIGTFLGRAQIDTARVQFSSELLRRVPGVRLITTSSRRDAPASFTTGRGSCRFRFLVDGTRMLADFELDMISPTAIEGIEVYTGMAQVPAMFRQHAADGGAATCGIIAVWTRNGR